MDVDPVSDHVRGVERVAVYVSVVFLRIKVLVSFGGWGGGGGGKGKERKTHYRRWLSGGLEEKRERNLPSPILEKKISVQRQCNRAHPCQTRSSVPLSPSPQTRDQYCDGRCRGFETVADCEERWQGE